MLCILISVVMRSFEEIIAAFLSLRKHFQISNLDVEGKNANESFYVVT